MLAGVLWKCWITWLCRLSHTSLAAALEEMSSADWMQGNCRMRSNWSCKKVSSCHHWATRHACISALTYFDDSTVKSKKGCAGLSRDESGTQFSTGHVGRLMPFTSEANIKQRTCMRTTGHIALWAGCFSSLNPRYWQKWKKTLAAAESAQVQISLSMQSRTSTRNLIPFFHLHRECDTALWTTKHFKSQPRSRSRGGKKEISFSSKSRQ